MKRAYTQMVPVTKLYLKKTGLSLNEYLTASQERYLKVIHSPEYIMARQVNTDHPDYALVLSHMCAVKLDKPVLEGNVQHIYLTDIDFCDWLVSCIGAKGSIQHAQVLQDNLTREVAVLHFPAGHKKHSIAFTFSECEYKSYSGAIIPKAGQIMITHDIGAVMPPLIGNYRVGDDLDAQKMITHDIGAVMPPLIGNYRVGEDLDAQNLDPLVDNAWYLRLILSIGMYVNTFPEMCKDGVPADLKHPNHHRYTGIMTLGIHSKCIVSKGGTHASPVSYIREPYWRTLRAPCFTKKRWQTILVSGYIANKGNAVTVLSPEEEPKKG